MFLEYFYSADSVQFIIMLWTEKYDGHHLIGLNNVDVEGSDTIPNLVDGSGNQVESL